MRERYGALRFGDEKPELLRGTNISSEGRGAGAELGFGEERTEENRGDNVNDDEK
jgi:hypothetical protein